LVDGGYMEANHLVASQRQYGMELIGPVQSNGRWQQEQGTGFAIGCFTIDWERHKALCPEGKTSSSWKPGVDGRGPEVITVGFAKADCHPCPSRSQCTKAKIQHRILNLKPQELHQALQQARRRQKKTLSRSTNSGRAWREPSRKEYGRLS
jgi:transposase